MAEKEKEKGKNNELINKLYQVVDCFNENMKRLISGGCYDFNTKDEYVCPSGDIYDTKDMICPDTITYSKATLVSYNCNEGFVLSGDKCVTEEIENAEKEKLCSDGFTLTDNGRCINYDNTQGFIQGNKCTEENSRLEGNICILLDIKNANKN